MEQMSLFKQDAIEIFKQMSLLHGYSEIDIEKYLLDPDIKLLLSIMQNYSDLMFEQLYVQEKNLSDSLIQVLAETLFRPKPAIVVFDTSVDIGAKKSIILNCGDSFSIFSNNGRQELRCMLNTNNWLSLISLDLNQDRNILALNFRLFESISIKEMLNRIHVEGINILLQGAQNPVSRCLMDFGSSNLRKIEMLTRGVDRRNVGQAKDELMPQNLSIELGLPISFEDKFSPYDLTPRTLHSAFLFPELHRGFRLHSNNVPGTLISNYSLSDFVILFEFQNPISDISKIKFIINPLIAASLKQTAMSPIRVDGSNNYCITVANGGSENGSIHSLSEVYISKFSGVGSTRVNNDERAHQRAEHGDGLFQITRKYFDKKLDCYLSTEHVSQVPLNSIISGSVLVCQEKLNILSDVVFLGNDTSNSETSLAMNLVFQQAGGVLNRPNYLSLSSLLSLSNSNLLSHDAKSYVNTLIQCSNPAFISNQNELTHLRELTCIAATMVHAFEDRVSYAYSKYSLNLVLSKSVEELPDIVTIALGIAKQIAEVWSPASYLCVKLYDKKSQLLAEHRNAD